MTKARETYLIKAHKEFLKKNNIITVISDDYSLVVKYRETRLYSTWRPIMRVAKKFRKLHYISTIYENTSPRAKYLKAEAYFEHKGKPCSLDIYERNNI